MSHLSHLSPLRISTWISAIGRQLGLLLVAAFWVISPTTSLARTDVAILDKRDIIHPVFATQGMVSTQEALATEIGLEVLKKGGNAVDAAVTIGFTLAVTLPRAGNLGGGGFMIIHRADKHETVALDFREIAPAAATRDMFLNEKGEADPKRSRYSYLAVAVPGTVAGLALALEKYGTLSLKEAIEPAIALAEQGFPVGEDLATSLKAAKEPMSRWPQTIKIFFKPDGAPYELGETLVQKELARSLREIADQGPQAFYKSEIAHKIVADMKANGGLITMEDLQNYKAVIREPVRGNYRGYEIVSMPPPSSGGIHLIQILNILENFDLKGLGPNTAATIHRMAEAMKFAYADRSEYLGDTDFVKVPVKGLMSKEYAKKLAQRIDPTRARPAAEIKPGNPPPEESSQTTHYSVIDKSGNIVSTTYTLNLDYGAGIVASGTGILLNNEMDDFSAKPGVPNAYGLIGGETNAVAPGKRPLSSMSPTLVLKDTKPYLVTGSPGGSPIITTVLQIILNMVDHGMNIAEATLTPRVHHQWLPDELRIEKSLNPDTVHLLEQMGYKVVVKDAIGSTQSIIKLETGLYGFSDTRRPGSLTAGY
jgi:gamma-glutamyltranspeptidase/glutathione hydrolase